MVDNFHIAYNYINENLIGVESFFFVEILKRKKENTYMKKDVVLKRFYVKTIDDLKKLEPEIKRIATSENARAILHVNEKSEKKLAFDLLKAIAARIEYEDYNNIHNMMDSLIAAQKSAFTKRWLLDIDKNEMNVIEFEKYKSRVRDVVMSTRANQEITEFPTPNGVHFIVLPFNSNLLLNEFPEIMIHKNNATVLFADTHVKKENIHE